MRDKSDTVLYVGKAVVLKNRVRSYFQKTPHNERITVMVSKIKRFEYIVCDSEYEALLLENNLIKKYKPKYNVLLKDDKGFPYIKVTLGELFPRVTIGRKLEKDNSKYFGPYHGANEVNNTIDTIMSIVPLRMCEKKLTGTASMPCLNYSMKLCPGPCCGKISKEDYDESVSAVISLLSGHTAEVKQSIKKSMLDASDRLDFEEACVYRERLKILEALEEKQKIDRVSDDDFDVIACAQNDKDACLQIFFIRSGGVTGREYYVFEGSGDCPPGDVISPFIKQFYTQEQFIPSKIYISDSIEDNDVLCRLLTDTRGKRCEILVPQRGDKRQLADMVRSNGDIVLKNREKALAMGSSENLQALERLKDVLKLDTLPIRMEAYDISNIGDTDIDGSMIVIINGMLKKDEYKKFKVKTVEHQSDADSLKEVLSRRIKRLDDGSSGFDIPPDVILADGGRTQIGAIKEVLNTTGHDIPVVGMVKDDRHRTRSLLYNNTEYYLKDDMILWRFISGIQDETHRVAISYGRKLAQKRHRSSVLDGIEGVGDKRKFALLKAFGSCAAIKKATLEELCAVDGMNKKAAQSVIDYFKNAEDKKQI